MELRPKTMLIGLLAVFALVSAQGCGGDKTSSSSLLPSTGTDDSVASGNGFYVAVDTEDDENPITTYLHKFNSFSTACSVSSTTTTPTDLQCLLNVRENDLYVSSIKLEVNAPASMCEYLVEQTYWYWDTRPGEGPDSLAVTIVAGSIASCTADSVTGTVSGAGSRCSVDEGVFNNAGEFTCAYDYTENNGANCCIGNYTFTKTTQQTVGGSITSTTSSGEYNGRVGDCASGPGVHGGSWPTDDDGLPMAKWNTVPNDTGLVRSLTIPSGLSINPGPYTSVYSANMYGWTNYVAGTHNAATLPLAMSVGTDTNGSAYPLSPSPAYTYYCLDAATDIKHRIRVYINDWDTNEEFESYGSSSGSTAYTPDYLSTDIEGTDCAVGDSIGIGFCDDFWDWDQISANSLTVPLSFPNDRY